VLNSKSLPIELNRINQRHKKQQAVFMDFAQDIIEFFSQSKLVDDLVLSQQFDQSYFGVSFINRRLQFRFEFDDTETSSIVVYDITNTTEIRKMLTCTFDGQGKVPFKNDENDDVYIGGGDGRQLFLHLLLEAVRPSSTKG
jgi:hypothetical protein